MISAIVHTYNEEKNIERCLSSLTGWVQEIILVDMFSKDKTCSLAKKHKAKIFKYQYTGFVEPARNYGISKSRCKWIIIVDADEEVPRALSEKLLRIKEAETFEFVRIPRKNIIFGKWVKHAGWWPDYQIRFFQKGKVFWTDKIHGVPLTRGQGFDLPADEDTSLIHYHYQTIEQYINRLNRYTSVNAKELYLTDHHFSLEEMFKAGVSEFNSRFFAKEGYKDGLHGFALSLLQSYSEAAVYLKLWELENFRQQPVDLFKMKKLFEFENNEGNYWIMNELLKKPQNFINRLYFRLQRKFSRL